MTRIVTTAYRYKRPPRKQKPVAIEAPAVVTTASKRSLPRDPDAAVAPPANDDRKPAIVTIRRPRRQFGDVLDMTPEEHQRRGDAADATPPRRRLSARDPQIRPAKLDDIAPLWSGYSSKRGEERMPIIAISRWQIDPEQARQVMQQAAPMMRQHGAERASIGVIRTGPQTGQTTVTVSFATWEAFGLAMAASATDGAYQALAAQMRQHGQLLDRFLLTEDDLQL